jgi:beta-galactosidase
MQSLGTPRHFQAQKRVFAMAETGLFKQVTRAISLLTVALLVGASFATVAQAADVVTTRKDENGWRLLVNGEDYYVKGVVWSYTPRGENYNYNLWREDERLVKAVIDYDFTLLKAAGVNSIRTFMMIPPKWITYIYETYGIRTVINPLMGRYGYTVAGRWRPFTDYSDPVTRAVLKADTLAIIDTYKNVPGVLMFALGNESNYGLEWSSFEIENLPTGEQQSAKARYLYSLFNEVIVEGKKIAPNHPFSIVNGDIQYIDLIAELVPELDILGSNVYRGKSFTDLWQQVDARLDLPVLFFEFGSDAFNAREMREDQLAQATYLKAQWQEMYQKAWGNGEEGNSIGGTVFQSRDEWWKYLQEENLDIHDTTASWSNQAYMFDWMPDANNMNEEWFGIMALGTPNRDGVYEARPRMAYDVLSAIWSIDPYQFKRSANERSIAGASSAIEQSFAGINMELYELRGEVRRLSSVTEEKRQTLSFTGGELRLEMVLNGEEQAITEDGKDGLEFSDGQMVFLDFAFAPTERIDGQFSINVLGNVAETEPLQIQYGRRGLSFDTVLVEGQEQTVVRVEDRERVEIYDFNAEYRGDTFDIEAFYHTPRYHWKYEGDFFGLIRETTDMAGMDIWNAKAPSGVEMVGKGAFEGLTLLVGPEVYWGANPKIVTKYDFSLAGFDYTFIHAEDVARLDDSATATAATERQSRQTTLYTTRTFANDMKLELGAIMSATEKVGDNYTRLSGSGDIILDEIEFKDTLGVKGRLTFDLFDTLSYVAFDIGGLVADGGDGLREFGTRLPYSNLGNKNEYEAGMMINFGDYMLFPRFLYRTNLVDANPFIEPGIGPGGVLEPGLTPRNREKDPFAVLGNREARSAEVFLTYDPTGGTPFYAWDNDWREDAAVAWNVGLNYTENRRPTDAYLFFFEPTGENVPFGAGLPKEDVWTASTRMVFNPNSNARYIINLLAGNEQSTGNPERGTREFYELEAKVVLRNRHIISGYFKKDAWGPYDFHRQFNVTFPEQYMIDYAYLMDHRRDWLKSTQIGLRTLYRSLDENSPTNEFLDGDNDYLVQTQFYMIYRF